MKFYGQTDLQAFQKKLRFKDGNNFIFRSCSVDVKEIQNSPDIERRNLKAIDQAYTTGNLKMIAEE